GSGSSESRTRFEDGEWRRILRSEHMSRSTGGSVADFKAKAPPEAPGLIIPLPTTCRGESRLTLRGAWRGGLGHRGSLIVEAETSDIQWPRFGLYTLRSHVHALLAESDRYRAEGVDSRDGGS